MAGTAVDILVKRLADWGVEVVCGFPATALTG
jgi:hypothetical protein